MVRKRRRDGGHTSNRLTHIHSLTCTFVHTHIFQLTHTHHTHTTQQENHGASITETPSGLQAPGSVGHPDQGSCQVASQLPLWVAAPCPVPLCIRPTRHFLCLLLTLLTTELSACTAGSLGPLPGPLRTPPAWASPQERADLSLSGWQRLPLGTPASHMDRSCERGRRGAQDGCHYKRAS